MHSCQLYIYPLYHLTSLYYSKPKTCDRSGQIGTLQLQNNLLWWRSGTDQEAMSNAMSSDLENLRKTIVCILRNRCKLAAEFLDGGFRWHSCGLAVEYDWTKARCSYWLGPAYDDSSFEYFGQMEPHELQENSYF